MESLFQTIAQAQAQGKRVVKIHDGNSEIVIYLPEPSPRTTEMMYGG